MAVSFRYSTLNFSAVVPSGVTLRVAGVEQSADFSTALEVGENTVTIRVEVTGGEFRDYQLTITRHRQYAYVTNVNTAGTDSVSLYSVDPETGQLVPLSVPSVTAGNDPYDLGISPDGKHLYVANALSNTLSQFEIDLTTGLLTPLTPATVAQSITPYGTLPHPTGKFVYSVNGGNAPGTISQYARNTTTGVLTALTPASVTTSSYPWFLAPHPNGRFLYATIFGVFANTANDTVAQFAIDADTGTLSSLSPSEVATQDRPWSVVVHPDGNALYVVNFGSASLSQYAIHPTNGTLSALTPATVATGSQPVGIAVRPDGDFLYVGNSGTTTVSQYSVSSSTGALTSLGTVSSGSAPYGLSTDYTGSYLYACNSGTNTVSQFRIQSDGTLTAFSPATVTAGVNPRFIAFSY